MAIKKSEHNHIEALGPKKWIRAHNAATRSVMRNDKMVGMDKIRMALAVKAALKGTGCEGIAGFSVPSIAGTPNQAVQDIADAAFADAVDAVLSSD
jgi:hypothetical protein